MVSAWALVVAACVVCLDQTSKAIVLARPRRERVDGCACRVRLRVVFNRRWRLGGRHGRAALVALWATGVGSAVALLALAPPLQDAGGWLGLACALAGATGNLLDRLVRGGVVDFIDIRPWPVFNLADAAISVGSMAAIGSLLA